MRKTKLMLGALAIASAISLSSCGFERTNAQDYEGTLEMYTAFFKKTFEYDNMKVVMDLEGGVFRTEYICASTSHSIDSNTDLETWAYLNKDGWKTVAYEYDLESVTGKTHWFKYDAASYKEEYKNFISYINIMKNYEDELERDPSLAEHTIWDTKREDLGKGKARFDLTVSKKDSVKKGEEGMRFVALSENGLVTKVTIARFGEKIGDDDFSRVITFTYGGVKSIAIPDVTGWPEE